MIKVQSLQLIINIAIRIAVLLLLLLNRHDLRHHNILRLILSLIALSVGMTTALVSESSFPYDLLLSEIICLQISELLYLKMMDHSFSGLL